jgi:hypothetical protein
MKSFILEFFLLKFLQVELICVLVCKLFKCHSNLGRLNLDHCLLVLHHHFMCMCGISLKPFLFSFLFSLILAGLSDLGDWLQTFQKPPLAKDWIAFQIFVWFNLSFYVNPSYSFLPLQSLSQLPNLLILLEMVRTTLGEHKLASLVEIRIWEERGNPSQMHAKILQIFSILSPISLHLSPGGYTHPVDYPAPPVIPWGKP